MKRTTIPVLATLVVMSSCSAGDEDPSSADALAEPTAAQVEAFGFAPDPDSAVVYQPDVIVVDGGAAAIQAVSDDDLVWQIDRRAPGAVDLIVGSVLFITNRAVGRVVAITDTDASREVTIAPIELTDLLVDGSMDLDLALDLSDVDLAPAPDLPGVLGDPDSGEPLPAGVDIVPAAYGSDLDAVDAAPAPTPVAAPVAASPAAQLTATPRRPAPQTEPGADPATGPGAEPPSLGTQSVTLPIGDWTVGASVATGAIKLGVSYASPLPPTIATPPGSTPPATVSSSVGSPTQLKAGVAFSFLVDDLRIRSRVEVEDGEVTRSGFEISGIKGFTVDLTAGIGQASGSNGKIQIEIPVEITFPVPPQPATAGLPFAFKLSFSFLLATALVGANSTLVASGSYALDGPIGVSGGTVAVPTFTVTKSIIDSLTGITLGPSGVVSAVKITSQLGLGTKAAMAGPYVGLTTSVGVTNGSSLGAPLARCKGASLVVVLSEGVGLSASPTVVKALEALLPKGTKVSASAEISSQTIIDRKQVVPDVPLCRS